MYGMFTNFGVNKASLADFFFTIDITLTLIIVDREMKHMKCIMRGKKSAVSRVKNTRGQSQ